MHFPEGTEENHMEPHSGKPVSRPRTEPGSSRIRSKSVDYCIANEMRFSYVGLPIGASILSESTPVALYMNFGNLYLPKGDYNVR